MWAQVVADLVAGRARRVYRAPPAPSLTGIPTPRYDLAESAFVAPVVTKATRGCPFRCRYCQLNIPPIAFRTRPIPDVIHDLTATPRLPWHKRKLAMLYDNNLAGDPRYAKDLLREIAKLDLWGLGVQFSLDNLQDPEYLDLLEAAHCRMAFLGMESLNEPSLLAVNKQHHRVDQYGRLFAELKRRGILVFAGTMLALDEDTAADHRACPANWSASIRAPSSCPSPSPSRGRRSTGSWRPKAGSSTTTCATTTAITGLPAEARDRRRRADASCASTGVSTPGRASSGAGGGSCGLSDGRRVLRRLGPAVMASFILLRLSVYQRGHLRDRVRPLLDQLTAPASPDTCPRNREPARCTRR